MKTTDDDDYFYQILVNMEKQPQQQNDVKLVKKCCVCHHIHVKYGFKKLFHSKLVLENCSNCFQLRLMKYSYSYINNVLNSPKHHTEEFPIFLEF